MIGRELEKILADMGDPALESFQKRIVSDTKYPMHCIRMPKLRELAKKLTGDWEQLLRFDCFQSYEAVLVLGLALAYDKRPFAQKLPHLRTLLPHIDSWGMTDSIVPTLKLKQSELAAGWDFVLECLNSPLEYSVRFAIVMLMDYYLHDARTLPLLLTIRDKRYYVRMALAWCMAEMAVKAPDKVVTVLERAVLDPVVQNMTLRKMRDSFRISLEIKDHIKTLKRKEEN